MSNPQASRTEKIELTTRTRTKVYCFCIKCNGKLVDPRTKSKHELKHKKCADNNFDNNYQEAGPSNAAVDNNVMECDPLPDQLPEVIEPLFERNCSFLTKKIPVYKLAKLQMIRKGKISDLVLENLLPDNEKNMNDDQDRDFGDEEEDRDSGDFEDEEEDRDSGDFEDNDDEDSDSEDFEDDDDEEVNFASTDFDDGEPNLPNIDINYNYTWIVLWILQYQQRYKLPNVAIDSLFKFLRSFLLTIDRNKFLSFPSSLYMAKETLGLYTNIIKYAACNKCHKLYDINEISNKTEIPTCSFINYPNHSREQFRQKCNNPLIKKIDSSKDNSNNPIFRPIMTFPLVNIRQLLTLFFGRKDFEMSCRKWAERKNETEALFDIYDGVI